MTRLKTPGGRSASTTHSASAMPGDGRRRRGRPHDGVAGGERGRDQLGRHRVRPVPRRDHADDAARAAHEQHALAGRDRVRDPALEPLAVLGGVAPVLDELLDLVARLGERLALVERERARERVAPLLDLVGDAHRASPRGRTALRRAQPSAARFAAAIARRASSRPPFWTAPIFSPVAGDSASNVSPDSATAHSPVDEHQAPARRLVVERHAHEVADRHDPERRTGVVHDRQVAEAAVDHHRRRVPGRVVRPDRLGVGRHPRGDVASPPRRL